MLLLETPLWRRRIMPTPDESRRALKLVTEAAVASGSRFLRSLSGSAAARRAALLEVTPELVGYFAEGSAALAADYYDEARSRVPGLDPFVAIPYVEDRTVHIRRATAWAARPLFDDDLDAAAGRLAEVIQLDSARPYRETILQNRRNDQQAIGWRRVTSGGCKLCRMLADRGAVYKQSSAYFATHPNCSCSAEPVFVGGRSGPEASVIQYLGSKRGRTPAQREYLRNYLDGLYPDEG